MSTIINDATKKKLGQQINGNTEGPLPKQSEAVFGNGKDVNKDPMITGNGHRSSDKTFKEELDKDGEKILS